MEFKDVILNRRSIRKYTDQDVSIEDLEEIIEAALWAPSGINLQPWYFVAIRSEENLGKLKSIIGRVYDKFEPVLEKRFSRNPEAITDTKNFMYSLGGAKICILAFLLKPDYEDEISVLEGTSAAIQNLCLMAHDKGLGTCWMTAPLRVGLDEEIRNEFAKDKGRFVASITLGYPEVIPKAPKRREGRFDII